MLYRGINVDLLTVILLLIIILYLESDGLYVLNGP